MRICLLLAILCFPVTTLAQRSEVIRGQVTSDSGRVIANATVIITRGPDRLVQQTTTSDSGRYTMTFENGTGDYLIAVQATGFKPARRRVTRMADERTFTADFVLSGNVIALDAIRIQANRPVRATTGVSATTLETGASERFNEGVVGGVPPNVAGDINTTVSTIPGAVMGPGGVSMLGAAPGSNLTTLNGMAIGAGALPRAARADTRVTGATFDATRGGFSGANVDVRLASGSRSFNDRTFFGTIDAPALQSTDAVGRALGVPNTNWRASGGMSGEAIRSALLYNVAVDASRSTRLRPDLGSADPLAYQLSGISVDSVQRIRTLAPGAGLPLSLGTIPGGIQRFGLNSIARLDDIRDSTRSRSLTMYLNESRGDNEGTGALNAPSAGAARTDRSAGAILSAGRWSGPGFSTLRMTRLNVGMTLARTSPYSAQPAVDVLVRTLNDATAIDAGVANLSLGGRGTDDANTGRWTVEGNHEYLRNIRGRRHQLRAIAWGRIDGLDQSGGANVNGRYSFASLDDLLANRPSAYSRTLVNPDRKGQVWNAATAVSHTFNPSRFFSLLYGVRVEANGLLTTPAENRALERTLGVATGGVGTKLHVSPRIGFSYTFNKAQGNGGGSSNNGFGSWYRYPTGVLRGGIGEFRDLWRPDAVADAAARTGLSGSALSLSCIGSSVPQGDWSLASSASRPTQCRDGSGALGERAPSVLLLGRNYDAPRSWRASLDYNMTRWYLMFRASALATYDLNQSSIVDANFAARPQFILSGEGNRPVFVSPSSIDIASGAVSAADSRRTAEYGRVTVLSNDLRGRGGQLNVSITPDRFHRKWRGWPFWSANYTLQRVDRQARGFDGAAAGDPREVEWAPAWSDARHVWLLQIGHQGKFGVVSAFARLQSGLPFTPLVQGDVNGDGRSGDRAFVSDPPTAANDPNLAAGLRSLLVNGSDVARECLTQSIVKPLARNGCRGPWTRTLNLTWSPPTNFSSKSWRNRVTMTVFASNVLGGLDQLVNGTDNMKGWGGVATPDPTLLIPRGFDPWAQAFRYDVNPRFAETRPSRTTVREPFRLTVDFNVRLHTDSDLQSLRRAIEPVKVNGRWERRGVDSLQARYLRETSSIHRILVFEADSLFLRPDQIEKLRVRDSIFSDTVRAIYRPLAEFLANEPDGVASKAALAKTTAAKEAYWEIFWKQPEIAAEILDSGQTELMGLLKDMLTVPQDKRKGNQYFSGIASRSSTTSHLYERIDAMFSLPRPGVLLPAFLAAPAALLPRGSAAQGRDTIRATVSAIVAEESPRTPFLFGSISGLTIDPAGRVIVADAGEARLVVLSVEGKVLGTVGRKGKGPGEFESPTGPAIGPDGALYVRNMSTVSRFVTDPKTGLLGRFDRAFPGPSFAPWTSKLATIIDTSGRLHFPLEVGLRDGLTHYAYQRYALDGKELDSIPVPMQPTARSSWASVPIDKGTGRMVKGVNVVPFHPVPVWSVSMSGTMITSPADRYLLTETDARGRIIRQVTHPAVSPPIPSRERQDSTAALSRRLDSLRIPLDQVRGMSDEVKSRRIPTVYPVFRSLSTAADGSIWARRWSASTVAATSVFDVLSPDGRRLRTVTVPANCTTVPAPAIRGGVFSCVQLDPETDGESLVIARVPMP